MKSIKLLSVFALILSLSIVACKSDSSSKDEARESLNTTPATTATTNTNATPATPAVPAGPLTKIEFAESTFDFGEIMEGDKVEHVYAFTNNGDEPLIISNAKGSCGCTVPDWPREPIAPGAQGEIKVVFNSSGKGKVGGNPQSKRVTITANTDPANTYLTIKGSVNKEEAPAS